MPEYAMSEQLRQAAEQAAELVRVVAPEAEAYGQAGRLARALLDPLRELAEAAALARIRVLQQPPRELTTAEATQISEILRSAVATITVAQFGLRLTLLTAADQVSLATDDELFQLSIAGLLHAGNPAIFGAVFPDKVTIVNTVKPPAMGQDAPAENPSLHVVALFLVLVWLVAISVPVAQLTLTQEVKDYLNSLYGTVALALAIHWRVNDKRKR